MAYQEQEDPIRKAFMGSGIRGSNDEVPTDLSPKTMEHLMAHLLGASKAMKKIGEVGHPVAVQGTIEIPSGKIEVSQVHELRYNDSSTLPADK